MRKLTIFTLIGVALILSGCTADNTTLNNNVNKPLVNTNKNTNVNLTNNNLNNTQVVNENQNTNNNQVADPLANWKTFSNPNGNYSFKYDTSWNVAIKKNNSKETLFGPNANPNTGLGGVEIRNFEGSLTEYVKYLTDNAAINFTSKQNINVNGLSAIQVDYTGVANQVGHGVYIKNGNQIINVHIGSQDKNNIEIFNKLLSTFKIEN